MHGNIKQYMQESSPRKDGRTNLSDLGGQNFGWFSQTGDLKFSTVWAETGGKGKNSFESLFAYSKLNSIFLFKFFFSKLFHNIKNMY